MRDMRRSYPKLSVVNQADVVGLLTVGSKASPKDDVLQIGDAGAKQLVQVKQQGEEKGLAALFEKDKKSVTSIFGPNGLPPFPTGMGRTSAQGERRYVMDADREEGFPEEYVLSSAYGEPANSEQVSVSNICMKLPGDLLATFC